MTEVNVSSGEAFGRFDEQLLCNRSPRWTMELSTMFLQQLSERCSVWVSVADTGLMYLCWLLFFDDEGWNLHASTGTERPPSGSWRFFQWMTFYTPSDSWTLAHTGEMSGKKSILQQSVEGSKLKEGTLGNVFVVFSGWTHYWRKHDGSTEEGICPCEPFHHYVWTAFPQNDGIY